MLEATSDKHTLTWFWNLGAQPQNVQILDLSTLKIEFFVVLPYFPLIFLLLDPPPHSLFSPIFQIWGIFFMLKYAGKHHTIKMLPKSLSNWRATRDWSLQLLKIHLNLKSSDIAHCETKHSRYHHRQPKVKIHHVVEIQQRRYFSAQNDYR